MMRDVIIWTGAGQIGMAIARRVGYGKKIIVGDKNVSNAQTISKIMNAAGFDVTPVQTDISSRQDILRLIAEGQKYGDIAMLINSAGVSPSQASIETILNVDLYGTAVLLFDRRRGYGIVFLRTAASGQQSRLNIEFLCQPQSLSIIAVKIILGICG